MTKLPFFDLNVRRSFESFEFFTEMVEGNVMPDTAQRCFTTFTNSGKVFTLSR